jgi:uncharacterized protein (TIGR00255 family)
MVHSAQEIINLRVPWRVSVNSMTGYAALNFDYKEYTLYIEIRSLNNKFLEIRFRLPLYLEYLEDRLRRILKRDIKRGKVDVTVKVGAKEQMERRMLQEMVSKYGRILEEVQDESQVKLDVSLSDMLSLRYLFNEADALAAVEVDEKDFENGFIRTIEVFKESRRREGEMTKAEIQSYIDDINEIIQRIESLSPAVVETYRNQLKEKIQELIGSQIDETRLMMEVAVFANKADISEELSRVKNHVAKMEETLESDEACGRELDFISQEINREINTIGAKVPDYSISECAVQIKAALEKIKEQVRNIE